MRSLANPEACVAGGDTGKLDVEVVVINSGEGEWTVSRRCYGGGGDGGGSDGRSASLRGWCSHRGGEEGEESGDCVGLHVGGGGDGGLKCFKEVVQ